ncbi:hypothetical protein A2U01_0071952 [Trifolium medium]|uniref:Uncharacterized protein n=1 Tax=Trifolium medium TaxID=97028 RepID=A0A392SP99_9FABA|nr:hypothetical protein [Trifolium medium]
MLAGARYSENCSGFGRLSSLKLAKRELYTQNLGLLAKPELSG